ncbi:MAG: DUF1190 domain-containing protein [Pseudomonadota bacterium]
MKRSSHVSVVILGAAAFALAGCQETQTEAAAFPDVASCKAAAESGGWFSAADCDATFAEAKALHEETAPRYESQELCEAEHGAAACGADTAAGGADSVSGSGGGGMGFMPFFMGYMIGQAFGGGRPIAQPVVSKAGGGFATPGGSSIGQLNSSGKVSAAAFDKAPVTKGVAPMTKTQVAARGGFGASAASRSVGG